MTEADKLIERLQLTPHPEGGWYRETWRAPSPGGERAAGTAIVFLLKSGERSHWHRVDAAEVWLWHAGDPMRLQIAPEDESEPVATLLGPPAHPDCTVQAVVPAHGWQAAEPQSGGREGYTLVSCVVAPGFDFAGFELAPPDWEPGRGT